MAVASCCALLAQALAHKVAYPGSASYLATEQSYWTQQEAALEPACIVTPQTTEDVSKAVSILTGANHCKFAIKSQGHAPAAGFANIQDGVTIDLTALHSVSLSANKQVATVGSGASWLDVYAYLDPHNVTVAGGRNGQVGVGGLTIGGGISYIGPRVGWACDNVINFETVLASGKIVNANNTHNHDLFRALKGGSNNFGIVTSFAFQTFPQGEILAGDIDSPWEQRDAVIKAFVGLADSPHYDPYAEMVTSFSFSPANGWTIGSLAAYTKAVTKPAALQPFVSVPGTNSSLHLTPISKWSNESAIPQLEFIFYTSTYGVSTALMKSLLAGWDSILKSAPAIPGVLSWGFTFEPLPTVYTQYGTKNGGNSLGTSPKDGNAMIVMSGPVWNNTASDAAVAKLSKRLFDKGNSIAKSMNMLHEFEYLNYANPSQNPLASYGANNLASLQAVSKKYDPRGVFQHQVPGGFKLFR